MSRWGSKHTGVTILEAADTDIVKCADLKPRPELLSLFVVAWQADSIEPDDPETWTSAVGSLREAMLASGVSQSDVHAASTAGWMALNLLMEEVDHLVANEGLYV